jgi:predicted transcriptional regulator
MVRLNNIGNAGGGALAPKSFPTPTEAELRIMRVLWSRPRCTVNDIVAAIPKPTLARNTIMTTLGILERKGFVRHDVDGRTFIYEAAVAEIDARRSALADFAARFFDSSPSQLMAHFIDSEHLTQKEIAAIQKMFGEAKDRK